MQDDNSLMSKKHENGNQCVHCHLVFQTVFHLQLKENRKLSKAGKLCFFIAWMHFSITFLIIRALQKDTLK